MSISFLILTEPEKTYDQLCSLLLEQGYFVQLADNEQLAIKLLETDCMRYHGLFMHESCFAQCQELQVRFANQYQFQNLPLFILPEGLNTKLPTPSYYINPAQREETIASLDKALIREMAERRNNNPQQEQMTKALEYGHFRIQTLDQAQLLSHQLASYCPNSDIVMVGLSELLINAIEHGNLDITYDEKSRLHKEGKWLEEVYNRLKLPDNQKKFVDIKFERKADEILITITDQGNGFDWLKYSSFDPSRFLDQHGRGIMMAKSLSFNHVDYNDKGNQVTCAIKIPK